MKKIYFLMIIFCFSIFGCSVDKKEKPKIMSNDDTLSTEQINYNKAEEYIAQGNYIQAYSLLEDNEYNKAEELRNDIYNDYINQVLLNECVDYYNEIITKVNENYKGLDIAMTLKTNLNELRNLISNFGKENWIDEYEKYFIVDEILDKDEAEKNINKMTALLNKEDKLRILDFFTDNLNSTIRVDPLHPNIVIRDFYSFLHEEKITSYTFAILLSVFENNYIDITTLDKDNKPYLSIKVGQNGSVKSYLSCKGRAVEYYNTHNGNN